MQNKNTNPAPMLIQYFAAIIIAVILAAILLPFVLIFCFFALLTVFVYSLRKRYFQRSPPVKPKGTVEILMPDEPLHPTEPPLKATTDADLEITIETLQKSSKKTSGTGIEKDNP
jgi:hypothetical protein